MKYNIFHYYSTTKGDPTTSSKDIHFLYNVNAMHCNIIVIRIIW